MSTPLEIRRYVESLGPNCTEEMKKVCSMLLEQLPKANVRGKSCPHCQFRMHNKRVSCPNCQRQVRPTSTYSSKNDPPPLLANDCNVCGNQVTSDAYTLENCGHLFHATCLQNWVCLGNTHCFCRETRIPANFI